MVCAIDELAQMKVSYNDSKRQENLLQNRRSLLELVDPKKAKKDRNKVRLTLSNYGEKNSNLCLVINDMRSI
jgi:hypothetical protein